MPCLDARREELHGVAVAALRHANVVERGAHAAEAAGAGADALYQIGATVHGLEDGEVLGEVLMRKS